MVLPLALAGLLPIGPRIVSAGRIESLEKLIIPEVLLLFAKSVMLAVIECEPSDKVLGSIEVVNVPFEQVLVIGELVSIVMETV